MLNIESIRRDFPILDRQIYGKPLIYLDNAATTQKPQCVIDAISWAYCNVNANVHRGTHFLSLQATELHVVKRPSTYRFLARLYFVP
jgi:cysteine desulfurase/selenocysteine lyase